MKRARNIAKLTVAALSIFIMIGCTDSGNNANAAVAEAEETSAEGKDFVTEDFVTEVGGKQNNPAYRIEKNMIISDNLPVVVDFYADWCGPCKMFAPTFHAAAEKYSGQAIFLSINVDENPELARTYEISSIPSTVFIQTGGGVLGKQVGLMDAEQLDSYINQLIATAASADMSI